MLYLIKSADDYKIGFTKDSHTLYTRLNSYKTHNPNFEVVGLRKGDNIEESRLHKKYKEYSLNQGNEWFNFKEKINEVLELFTQSELEYYILTVFNLQVKEIEEYNIGEIYDRFDFVTNIGIFNLFYSEETLYMNFKSNNKNDTDRMFKVEYKELKSFFRDYDEYRESYRGFKIDDYLYYNFRSRNLGESDNIANINTPLFNKVKDLLRDVK